jgi:hypothetical protein
MPVHAPEGCEAEAVLRVVLIPTGALDQDVLDALRRYLPTEVVDGQPTTGVCRNGEPDTDPPPVATVKRRMPAGHQVGKSLAVEKVVDINAPGSAVAPEPQGAAQGAELFRRRVALHDYVAVTGHGAFL